MTCAACDSCPNSKTLFDYEEFCLHGEGSEAILSADVSEISVYHLNKQMEMGERFNLLDVREPTEHKIANIGGILIPLGQLPSRLDELDRGADIVVYCHHGKRSGIAVEFLKRQGFNRVLNLTGGIEEWSKEIDPTVPRY